MKTFFGLGLLSLSISLFASNSGLVRTDFRPLDNGRPQAIAADSTGGCILAAKGLCKLNASGVVDTKFNPELLMDNSTLKGSIFDLHIDSQGRVLVFGDLFLDSAAVHQTKASIVLLDCTGKIDSSFCPVLLESSDSSGSTGFRGVQTTSGDIWVVGDFSKLNGASWRGIAKISSSGTLEDIHVSDDVVSPLLVSRMSNDNIAITYYDSRYQQVLAILTQNGSFDPSFPVCKEWNSISTIKGLSSGDILVCGSLASNYQKCARIYSPNGQQKADIPFIQQNSVTIFSTAEADDGKMLLACSRFDTSLNTTVFELIRFNTDGSRDVAWTSLSNANKRINSIVFSSDSCVYAIGYFTAFENIASPGVVKLTSASTSKLSISNVSAKQFIDNQHASVVGFVIQGNEAIEVLVRAVGPGLAPFIGDGYLLHPSIDVFGANVLEFSQHGWSHSPNLLEIQSRLGAFPLSENSNDCILRCVLAPGAHSIVVYAPTGESGYVLTEVYQVE